MDIMLTTRYLDDLTALGVTLPAKTAAARDIYEEAVRTAQRQPSDDLRRALEAGTVTPQNVGELVYKAAADLTAQQNASQIVRDLHTTLNKSMSEGLRDDAARIHAELQAVFDPAAAAITKAAQHFGPDTTSDEVIGLKPDVIKLWNQADAHSRTLEDVSRTYRRLLSDITRELPTDIASLFVTAPADIDHAGEVYRLPTRWLALASSGFILNLNTPEEAHLVVRRSNEVKAKAAAVEREIDLKAHRRRYMPVGI